MDLLWFKPVFPDACADTPKSSLLDKDLVTKWLPPKRMPLLKSDLVEIPSSLEPKRFLYCAYDHKESNERGIAAENEFCDLAKKMGWILKNTAESDDYDYKHHVDAMFKVEGDKEIWVDIKCTRSLRRGWSPQSEFMWVELQSSGWLFGGKANVIAQQVAPRTFLLFDKLELASYVKEIVETSLPVVPYAEQSFNRVFVRETKGPIKTKCSYISLVRTEDAFKKAGCGVISD